MTGICDVQVTAASRCSTKRDNPSSRNAQRPGFRMLAALALFSVGCTSIEPPIYYAKKEDVPGTAPVSFPVGYNYCRNISNTATRASVVMLSLGIAATVVAAGLVITGTAMGPDTTDQTSWFAQNRNSLTVATGGLLAVPGTVLLMRSNSAGETAANAVSAMKLDDYSAYQQCINARADAIRSRAGVNEIDRKPANNKPSDAKPSDAKPSDAKSGAQGGSTSELN